jgi:hypothetical protein
LRSISSFVNKILALKDEITANKSAFDKDKSEYKNELMGVLLERDVATVLPKYRGLNFSQSLFCSITRFYCA